VKELKSIVVQKYGGSSVATVDKLNKIAQYVVKRHKEGFSLVVVVSAMGETTNQLLERAHQISEEPNRRELDMLLTVGERISMSLLAMAIREHGAEAVSLTGSQSGIITTASHSNARIMEVRPFRIQDELEQGRIVICAGFQGVSYKREITTLGRGGSDTTAVALAAALQADACEIYSDVDGVLSADPRIISKAQKIAAIGYEEMQEMSAAGAKVLNATAVEFAKNNNIAIYARKTGSSTPGTVIRRDVPRAAQRVRGVAHNLRVTTVERSRVSYQNYLDFIQTMHDEAFHPKVLSFQNENLIAVFGTEDLHRAQTLDDSIRRVLGPDCIHHDRGIVSLIGEGITEKLDLVCRGAKTVEKFEVFAMSTSRFRISWIMRDADIEEAAQLLHNEFCTQEDTIEVMS